MKKRFFVLYILVGAFFVTAGVRLVFLQVREAEKSRNEVDKRLSLSESDPAPRGDICDRNGTVLAGNRKGYVVLVKKGENAHLALTVKNLAEESGIEYKELLFMMQEQGFSKNTPYVLTEDATAELITKISESPESFPCAEIITRPVRDYIFPETAVHLLGRCGIISGEEYESLDGYGRNDYIGKQGAEKAFEDILRGKDGRRATEKYTPSGMRKFTEDIPPEKGKNVILTIDINLQTAAEEALDTTVKATGAAGGAFVMLDVSSGEVLSLASNPDYNINEFNKNYTKLSKNPQKPFFNRSISGLYEPGSTFKPITAIAAMESGVLSPDEIIKTKGEYEYFGHTFRCNIFREKGKNHGSINVSEALGVSCNYFFYELGHRVGIDKIEEVANQFGLGDSSGIELALEEAKGKIATPEERKASGGVWYAGDTLQASIGQSDNRFTPLALANYTAALANGGMLYRTHILKAVADKENLEYTKPEILNKITISEETRKAVIDGMLKVTTTGTAAEIFKGFPIKIAGKTGSAQVNKRTNGLFIGFAPAENPEIAFCAVVEGAPSGNTSAKMTKDILSYYFNQDEKGTSR